MTKDEIKPTPKMRRILRLFKAQQGFCWICGHPMLLPVQGLWPSRWTATIDHLGEANGQARPVLAAHRGCNNRRHHDDVESLWHEIEYINGKFANRHWVASVFGNAGTQSWWE